MVAYQLPVSVVGEQGGSWRKKDDAVGDPVLEARMVWSRTPPGDVRSSRCPDAAGALGYRGTVHIRALAVDEQHSPVLGDETVCERRLLDARSIPFLDVDVSVVSGPHQDDIRWQSGGEPHPDVVGHPQRRRVVRGRLTVHMRRVVDMRDVEEYQPPRAGCHIHRDIHGFIGVEISLETCAAIQNPRQRRLFEVARLDDDGFHTVGHEPFPEVRGRQERVRVEIGYRVAPRCCHVDRVDDRVVF